MAKLAFHRQHPEFNGTTGRRIAAVAAAATAATAAD
jgi:hypothetical protein